MGGFEKKALREHRTLLLWDETGHSFRARPDTTWARRGLTPVLRRVSKRREVSSVVAVTPDGRLYARHVRTSVSSETVISVLRSFRRQVGTPLLVVWDRLNAHRSKLTSAFIAAHSQDYAVAYLPAYAPELNPEEEGLRHAEMRYLSEEMGPSGGWSWRHAVSAVEAPSMSRTG
jgi:transposase